MPPSPIRPLFYSLCAIVLSMGLVLSAPAGAEETAPDLRGLLATESGLRLDGRQLDRAALLAIYQAHDFTPLWIGEPKR
jgi:hypothetical protein